MAAGRGLIRFDPHAKVTAVSVEDPNEIPDARKLPKPPRRSVGEFEVRRILPSVQRTVGPFVFVDEMGPAEFAPGQGIDVRPHPHIGLATMTYLFEGLVYHRDSLGTAQQLEPGAVNWMTAGRGIVHSERTPPDIIDQTRRMHGLQVWVGLPHEHEETEPAFDHYPKESIPSVSRDGIHVTVVAGRAYGVESPVKTFSPLTYLDYRLEAGATIEVPTTPIERALYPINGKFTVKDVAAEPAELVVLKTGATVSITATEASHVVLFGGDPLDGPRRLWWNFVSSSAERIDQAKEDWKEGRFGLVPGDEKDFIPLP